MPRSMTGYGRAELSEPGLTVAWEIKSVNSRFLDLKWRTPPALRSLEADMERAVRQGAARGRLELYLHLDMADATAFAPRLNVEVVKAMLAQVETLAKAQGRVFEPDLTRVLGMSSLWQENPAEPDPQLRQRVLDVLRQALAQWNDCREREGRATVADISARAVTLQTIARRIHDLLPEMVRAKNQNLADRVRTLLHEAGADCEALGKDRLLQEVAILADRLDVSEELARLEAHLQELAAQLAGGGELGKRLDFLLQEIFREITTCGNKSQDAEVSRLVVQFKAELEKCREQIQNLE